MALGRIRRPEGLRRVSPGEIGKLIGLDRCPEVRSLRNKLTELVELGDPGLWLSELSRFWMQKDPDEAGYLYVDGHVRVYNGETANLPPRYVSRQRLCLRGTTDYWVNDALGKPFFVVSKPVNEGLGKALLNDIVPDLLASVPNQPTQAELEADLLLARFIVIFDREGANYSLLSGLWEKRIGAITYRKNVKDVWPESEFSEIEVDFPDGNKTKMMLAIRESTISSGQNSMPVLEVRRLSKTGHQTAIITTARLLKDKVIAARMFSRWCQENFFAYMLKHYDIDGIIEYEAEDIPSMSEVVNPVWKSLDKAVREALRKVKDLERKLGGDFVENDGVINNKAETCQDIQSAEEDLAKLRSQRKNTPKKIPLSKLPENERPTQLLPLKKQFVDAVKMIAYRAETALVDVLRRYTKKTDEARALIREIFVSSADIIPDEKEKTLTIKVHGMTCNADNKALEGLLNELTEQEFHHPETGAKMIYKIL